MNKHGRETHHLLKIGKMLVAMDLCILNQERNDGWFQDRHRQETVALLEEFVGERIHVYYAKKRAARGEKKVRPKPEQPKMLEGNTVKIGYKFTKRPVTQRCLFTKAKSKHVTLFPEKLHVYICEYHPSTVLQTTAQLLHTVYKETEPSTIGISNYFKPTFNSEMGSVITVATTSAVKKRNKLKRIVSRQNNTKPANKDPYSTESGYDHSAGYQAVGHDTKETGDKTDGAPASRPRLRNEGEDTQAKESLGPGASRRKTSTGAQTGQRPVTEDQKVTTSERESVATTRTLGDYGVGEPTKKRKRNKDWIREENVHNKATSGLTSSGIDQETRELVKRHKPDDAAAESGKVLSHTMQSKGRTDSNTKEQAAVVVASDDDAVAMEGDGDVEMADADNENLKLCREEVFSDGDVDGLDHIKLDTKNMNELSCLHLQRLVSRNKSYLKEIFVGKRPCKRHADYKQGGSTRASLRYQAWYGPYSEEQVECVMKELVKIYCATHNKYFDYISKVLLPEALIKICMDVLHIPMQEAKAVLEKTPLCGDATLLGSRCRKGMTDYSQV